MHNLNNSWRIVVVYGLEPQKLVSILWPVITAYKRQSAKRAMPHSLVNYFDRLTQRLSQSADVLPENNANSEQSLYDSRSCSSFVPLLAQLRDRICYT